MHAAVLLSALPYDYSSLGDRVRALTASTTDVGDPFDANPVPDFDARTFCSWAQFDDMPDSFVAANLVNLSVH